MSRLFERAEKKASLTGRNVLVSVTEPLGAVDPLEVITALGSDSLRSDTVSAGADWMYWNHPADGFEIAGVGAAATFIRNGPNRFEGIDSGWLGLLDGALIEDVSPGLPGVGPTLMCGFAFDSEGSATGRWREFPGALGLLPRFQLAAEGQNRWLTTNVIVGPDGVSSIDLSAMAGLREHIERAANSEDSLARVSLSRSDLTCSSVRSADDWKETVAHAVSEIRAGALQKVVLAREERAVAPDGFDVAATLRYLRSAHPDCYVFGAWRGGSAFVGASPERLVRMDGREIRASSLAGSVRRGVTPEEDETMQAALRSSEKDHKEHEFVRSALYSRLGELCDDIAADEKPSIRSLKHVHHLHTALCARLRPGHSLLDVVARLHPTPAVGGEPRDLALEFIREHEQLDRGWYAAPIGWLQRDRGEFAVALRSALITGSSASLFAGCGIVADSVPEQEYRESQLKLRSMELALSASVGGDGS